MPSHKNNHRFAWLFLVFLAVFFLPDNAFAQVAGGGATLPTGIEATIATMVSKMIGFMNILIWILFIFLNFVLDPQFIFDLDNGEFMAVLNQIWQLSRDLMNVGFALMLVGTAIYTIVTANKEFVTQHAKKFIMAIVLVNFSWFFPRVIIDIANVTTATIYGIPSLLMDGSISNTCQYKSSSAEHPACTPASESTVEAPIYNCKCRVVTNVDMFMDATEAASHTKADGWDCQGDLLCVQTKPWAPNLVSGHSAVLNGLIMNHAHLQTMATVPAVKNSDSIAEMTQFLIVEGIIVIIHIALFFPLLAMFVAFVIRIPILWLTIPFMPFIFLNYVMSENELTGMTKKIWEHFLKAAFLPAMVAVPLAVGFILVNAGAQLSPSPIAGIKIRLLDGVSNYWQLLWWIMTLGVFWVGTFTVLENAGGLYAKVASSIKSYGEAWGKVALKAPLSVPLPGVGMTPLSMLRAVHPRTIDAKISGDEGLAGYAKYLDDVAKGNATIDPAEKFAKGPDDQLTQLHKDLEKLEADLRANKLAGNDPLKKQELLDAFKQKNGVDLSGDTGRKLDDFVKQLKQNGVNTNKQDRNFEQRATNINQI
ncbi:hypothetical protein K8942_03765 [Candidatus Peribacteria bacterium]|nr:MAG: hypothetical protein K8942_03765 [Candidatus Peribacteria bacterium]